MIKFIPAAALVFLAACSIDPKDYESEPVTVETAAGPVVCQLYTKNIVRWDRAIQRPSTMSVETADQICLNEGLREKNGSPRPGGASESDLAL
ncbi:hypothetical protein NM680_14315 [Paracoccus sp. PS-1]|uniref:hypothetical protein n=1 Tax=unclassified Paracoccus (in: a-proteobacteria) TaxID=2688777 RepID=UPI0004BB93AC|nr:MULTISPECIES: hypothetical protein [unclassified Paracoccus (in: a-proteobacteria)]MDQ7262968.1 hypothetical protein [Paracoccus sp. PS1]